MLNRVFGKNFHDHFHLFGICVLAIGLPTSKVILSVGMMLLVLNLLLEGSFANYWQEIKKNRFFHFLALYWSLHIIGLLWTSDFEYASNDLRIKLTLLIIPLILTVKPIRSHDHYRMILLLFVATLCVTSLYNFASYQHWIGRKNYEDIRELSLFGSHIRYGILIAVGAGICIHYLSALHNAKKWILFPVLIWFGYYTFYSQIISGFIAFTVVLIVFIILKAFSRSRVVGISIIVLSVLLLLTPFLFFLTDDKTVDIDYISLESHTEKGNPYTHFLGKETFIDGKPVLAYVCEKELKVEWDKRSNLSYDSLDLKGQPLRFTLMRYMTSKNLKKDANGFGQLTNQDISHIEKGIASIKENQTGLTARLEGIKFQLHNSVDPNGHSLLQRFEYWKTGLKIIQQNWLIGVGTGDVQKAFDEQYKKDNSTLLDKNRLRAHNTYLTNWISFGIIGFFIFLWMIYSFLRSHFHSRSYLPMMFMLVACSTFFIEDTLETQMGVTFFAFFYGLFSVTNKKEDPAVF